MTPDRLDAQDLSLIREMHARTCALYEHLARRSGRPELEEITRDLRVDLLRLLESVESTLRQAEGAPHDA